MLLARSGLCCLPTRRSSDLTRLASILLLLPMLIGAVFFVNITRGFSFLNSEFWLSLMVMILLIVFVIWGFGRYSLDNMMNKPRSEEHTSELQSRENLVCRLL